MPCSSFKFTFNWFISGVVAALLLCNQNAVAQISVTRQREIDDSVARGLAYIAARQNESGSWSTEAWGESTAITSIAVMSFLAAGHVPGEGPYGEQISRGVRWVVSQQQPNGMLIRHAQSHGPMYDHGICSLMLGEVSGMLDGADAVIVRRALERAILLILEAQVVEKFDRHQGGWRYQIDSRDSDLSVTGWQVMALRGAKDIGCDVPVEAIDLAVKYVKMCSDQKENGFGYQPGNSPTPTLTGCGITCLEVCGDHHSDETLKGVEWLKSHPIVEKSAYFYYGVYYTSVGVSKVGGDVADKHYIHITDTLLPLQDTDGSWQPNHGSEKQAGRIYSTGLSILALTVEYRYLPIYQR
ncbi:prenyltransferase/squalene oxidase repeat-containing protein [Planctomicrobium sp. SH668]|uniref:prenyltransferase/squalene oxidase repeat-containing protein n=1 Tax=Planctomicrobium sp. SH668 TaxID=3448126 RepID=UPI003F5B41DA